MSSPKIKHLLLIILLIVALSGVLIPVHTLAAPVVETYCATGIDGTSATLKGNLTSIDTATVDVSFEWGTTQGGPYDYETNAKTLESTGIFEIILRDELDPETTYYFIAKADDGISPVYGEEKTFTTTSVSIGSLSNNVLIKGLILTNRMLDRWVSDVTNGTLTSAGMDLASGIAYTFSGVFNFIGTVMLGLEPDAGSYMGNIISDLLKFFGSRVPLSP